MSKHVFSHILESGIDTDQWKWYISRIQLKGYQREQICKIKYQFDITNHSALFCLRNSMRNRHVGEGTVWHLWILQKSKELEG